MRRQHSPRQISIAYRVANNTTAEDSDLVARKIRNLLVVAAGLGVAKSNDAGDLVLDSGGEVFDGAVGDGGALAGQQS